MKRLLVACLLAVLAVPAFAVIGTVDDVPASTLLLPYFEVDLDNPDGVTTLMSINNASATAVLTHVVLWTDLSVHVLDFNVYLTGYDVQTINLRDIIINGFLPLTGEGYSNEGPSSLPAPQSPYPNCDTLLPYTNPALNAVYIDHLQSALTGQSSDVLFSGDCSGVDHDDRIARGYVTVDTVNECSFDFPQDADYFEDGGTGTASNQNQIWGDYFYVNPGENFAQGETLVHIESEQPRGSVPDSPEGILNYTFYYRYSGGDDNREGLSNAFAVRYLNGAGFDGGTDLLVWRDSTYAQDPFSCGTTPYPFQLGQNQIVVFDEEENYEVPEGCTISPCPPPDQQPQPFPWEAQRTHVGGADLPSSYNFGWIFLNLNFDIDNSFDFAPLMQNWVTAVMDANGRFSVGFDAIQLGNVTDGQTGNDLYIDVVD